MFLKPLMRIVFLCMVAASTAGCQISDTRAQTVIMGNTKNVPKQFILIGAGQYEGDLSIALFQQGFKVKPIAVTNSAMELESSSKIIGYKEAGYRYALRLSISHNYIWTCTFSSGHLVDVTMTVIDIGSNEIIAIIKQSGPDRKCPPLTPIWDLLAKELAKAWAQDEHPPTSSPSPIPAPNDP